MRKRNKGVSLVEVLVAACILGLVLTFAVAPFRNTDAANSELLVRQRALDILGQRMDSALTADLGELNDEAGTESVRFTSPSVDRTLDFRWALKVSPETDRLTKIHITVENLETGYILEEETLRYTGGAS